jgi:hypothetical protein
MVRIKCPHRTGMSTYIIPIIECVVLIQVILMSIGYVLRTSQVDYIKDNWQTLKCNPKYFMYYPVVSENIEADISSCMETIMEGSIGKYLSPLNIIFSSLSQLGANISYQLSRFIEIIEYIRDSVSSMVSSFFGYMLKILLIFYKFQMALQQILSRFVGVIMTSVYMMRGQLHFGNSIWNGPPGQMVRVLTNTKIGHCFHEDTNLYLSNGTIKKIKDICIGDELIAGTTVVATMVILNAYNECLYSVPDGVNGEPIYVSGTHYVYNSKQSQFQIVETLEGTHLTTIMPKRMYCLITSNNMIPIGNKIFWDWEDYKINRLAP